jgi:hypothetical protein
MRERGKYQIQCMKSRSSTGVGQKIDLEYNIETMRITDEDPDGYADQQAKYRPAPSPNQIMSQLKPQSTVTSDAPFDGGTVVDNPVKGPVDVQGARLKAMLNAMRK